MKRLLVALALLAGLLLAVPAAQAHTPSEVECGPIVAGYPITCFSTHPGLINQCPVGMDRKMNQKIQMGRQSEFLPDFVLVQDRTISSSHEDWTRTNRVSLGENDDGVYQVNVGWIGNRGKSQTLVGYIELKDSGTLTTLIMQVGHNPTCQHRPT